MRLCVAEEASGLVAKRPIKEQIVELHRHKRDHAERLLEGSDASALLDADELLAGAAAPVDRLAWNGTHSFSRDRTVILPICLECTGA